MKKEQLHPMQPQQKTQRQPQLKSSTMVQRPKPKSHEVTKEGDKVTAVSIDEVDEEGLSKKDLGDDYGMKKASTVEKEWYEQVEFLENYILENGVDSIKLNDEGKAENEDLKSGCTISIKNMVDAVKEAEAK